MAKLIQLFGLLDAKKMLEAGKAAAFIRGKPERMRSKNEPVAETSGDL